MEIIFFSFLLHAYTSRYKLQKTKSCVFLLWSLFYLEYRFTNQLVSHSRGAVRRSSTSCHPAITFPDHLLRQCSTTLSQHTQRRLFFTSLCVVHLPVTPNDPQRWKSCYCGFCCCSLSCCACRILPVRFIHHGLHEGDLEASWSSLWKTRGRKNHASIFNSRVVRAQEMRPGGSSCKCVCFGGAAGTCTSDSWWKLHSTDSRGGCSRTVPAFLFWNKLKIH